MLKIGIVGAGGMGTVHYSNYQRIAECKVVALVGIGEQDKKRAEEWNLPLYSTIFEMLDQEEVDVVDICTPTFLHKLNVIDSLSRGKDTIVEKPIALSKKDAMEMFALAHENKCHLYVAHVLQFTKEIGIVRELIKNQTYGKVMDAYFERLSACPEWVQGGWLFDQTKSGLLPFDLHIHDLDVIVRLFGKPKQSEVTENKREESEYVEHYRIAYSFEQVNVVAEAAWFHANIPFTARWRVCFENAVLVYDGKTLIAYPYQKEPVEYDIQDKVIVPTGINVPPTGWYFNELSEFLTCIRNNQECDYVNEKQLLTVLEILEEINGFTKK